MAFFTEKFKKGSKYRGHPVHSTVHSCQVAGVACVSNSGTLTSNRQNTASPKYNDDISLPISQYHISGQTLPDTGSDFASS
jgi:hypothetical protein